MLFWRRISTLFHLKVIHLSYLLWCIKRLISFLGVCIRVTLLSWCPFTPNASSGARQPSRSLSSLLQFESRTSWWDRLVFPSIYVFPVHIFLSMCMHRIYMSYIHSERRILFQLSPHGGYVESRVSPPLTSLIKITMSLIMSLLSWEGGLIGTFTQYEASLLWLSWSAANAA